MKSTVLQLFLRETMWKWGSNAQHLRDIKHLVLPTSTSVKTLRFYVKNKRKNNPQTKKKHEKFEAYRCFRLLCIRTKVKHLSKL